MYVIPLSCTLKNGSDGKLYVMCILTFVTKTFVYKKQLLSCMSAKKNWKLKLKIHLIHIIQIKYLYINLKICTISV